MRGRNPQWRPSTGRLVGVLAVTVATVSFTGVRVSWGATGTPLAAEGGSFADPIINLLQNDPAALTAISPFTPSYFDADVDQARQDFVAGATDYAVTELPLTAGEAATAAQNGRSFAYVPFAASPLAIAAVVECSQTSTLTATTFCGTIKVTVPILAQIFTDLPPTASPPPGGLGIGRWNDPELTALTPSLGGVSTASADITALEDVQPAASNYALETLFVNNATAKPIWDAYLKFYEGVTDDTPTDLWPHTNGTSGGDVTLAQSLIPINEQANPPAPPSNPQTWGQGVVAPLPIDWTGAPRNIPTMAVQNAAGAFVQPSVASMSAALQDATMDPTTNLVTFTANPNDAAAYPIPVMSYLVVPTSGLAPAKATALAAFIKFVLGSTGQAEVESLGAAGVTPAMVTAGLQVAAQVAAEASTTTTTTTTSPTTSTSTPASTTASTSASPNTSGQGVAGGSGAAAATTSTSSPSLALTGGVPWPVPLVGGALVLVGFVARRTLRSRITPRGSKT